jgi:hypothetical protein
MMRRRLAILVALLALAAFPVYAQHSLPQTFGGWVVAAPQDTDFNRATGEAAPILKEDGAESVERLTYTNGSDTLLVTLYRLKDPSAGYGAYSFLRGPEIAGAKLTEHSSLSRNRALILIGNFVVDVSGKGVERKAADLNLLISQVNKRAAAGLYPTLWQYMPQDGIVSHSDRYILGPVALNHELPLAADDWLGFSNGAEAELARYHLNGQELTLVLVEYPTPQIASKQLETLATRFNLNSTAKQSGENAKPVLFARQTSSLVALVANARSQTVADLLFQNVKYEANVTWNEPSFSLTQPGWGTIIVGIFVGTGLLCVFALASGLAFGIFRVVVKHFWPGKVFDRPNDVEILQLGISSKPIEAKDFYVPY